jgi:hypothetical protein
MSTHTHPCRYKANGCTGVVRCSAPMERNYDGWPEVVCAAETAFQASESCEDCAEGPYCPECGIPEHLSKHHATGCPNGSDPDGVGAEEA